MNPSRDDATTTFRDLTDLTLQRIHGVLDRYEAMDAPPLRAALDHHASIISQCYSPFSGPSKASRERVESGKVTLSDGTLLQVTPEDKETVWELSTKLDLDEVQALTLFRLFLFNEGLTKTHPTGPYVLMDALTDFYFEERLYAMRLAGALLRIKENMSDPHQSMASEFISSHIPNLTQFAQALLDAVTERAHKKLRDPLVRDPRIAARWAKQNLKEQLCLLEVIFWSAVAHTADPAFVSSFFEAIHHTNLGRHQEYKDLLLDDQSAQLFQDIQVLFGVTAVQLLKLDKLLDETLDLQTAMDTWHGYLSSPDEVDKIHNTVANFPDDAGFSPIVLAWGYIVSRISRMPRQEIPDNYHRFYEVLNPPPPRRVRLAIAEPTLSVADSVISRAVMLGLFPTLLRYLKSPHFSTTVAATLASAISDPNNGQYRYVLKCLVMAVIDTVQVEYIQEYELLVEVWTGIFGSGEMPVVVYLCSEFWTRDLQHSIQRRSLLDLALSRFPVEPTPLLKLLRAMGGSGGLAELDSVTDEGEEATLRLAAVRNVYNYFLDMQCFTQVLSPHHLSGPQALYETRPDPALGYYYTNSQAIRLPGGSILPAGSYGRVVSTQGAVVVAWMHKHSGWHLLLDVLWKFHTRITSSGSARGAAKQKQPPNRPVSLDLEDVGLQVEDEAEFIADILDLFRSLLHRNVELATQMVSDLRNQRTQAIGMASIATIRELFEALQRALRFVDASNLISLLQANLRLIQLVLVRKRAVSTVKLSLLEQTLFSGLPAALNSFAPRSSRLEPIDVIARLIENRSFGQPVATQATQLLSVLCSSTASVQPSCPSIVGHLNDPEGTAEAFIRVLTDPYDDLELRKAMWDLVATLVDTQPAFASLLISGTLRSSKQTSHDTTDAPKEAGTKKTVLSSACDIVGRKVAWDALPAVFSAALNILDLVWQHALQHVDALKEIRENQQFWRDLASVASRQLGPPPVISVEMLAVESANGLVNSLSQLDRQISRYSYHATAKAHALHVLAMDLKLASPDGQPTEQKPLSFDVVADLFRTKEDLEKHIVEAIYCPFMPSLHRHLQELINTSFPTFTLDSVRFSYLPSQRSYGNHYLYQSDVVQARLMKCAGSNQELGYQATSIYAKTCGVNLNWSLTDAQVVLMRSWGRLLQDSGGWLRSKDEVELNVLASASKAAKMIAEEARQGDVMRAIHAGRLSLLQGLLEVAWLSGRRQLSASSEIPSLLNSVRFISSSEVFPPLDSIRRQHHPTFHHTLLRIIYFTVHKATLLVQASTTKLEQRLAIGSSVNETLGFVIDGLRCTFDLTYTSPHPDLDQDMKLLVAVFEKCTKPELHSTPSPWLSRCQEVDLIRSSLDVLLCGAQLTKVLGWTFETPLTLTLLEEMHRTVHLFHAIAVQSMNDDQEPSGGVQAILQAFTERALLLLQQLNFVLSHPNHLSTLLEAVTPDERKQMDKEIGATPLERPAQSVDPGSHPLLASVVQKLLTIFRDVTSTLLVIGRSDMLFRIQHSVQWARFPPYVVADTKVARDGPASIGTLRESAAFALDVVCHLLKPEKAKAKANRDSVPSSIEPFDASRTKEVALQVVEEVSLYAFTQLSSAVHQPYGAVPVNEEGDVSMDDRERSVFGKTLGPMPLDPIRLTRQWKELAVEINLLVKGVPHDAGPGVKEFFGEIAKATYNLVQTLDKKLKEGR
ncbi:hypothetical protein FRB99_007527 [Tulasnella sp. 403]|nr:hypothetical protein FRB99_007527 [Tulasnella sp. 403]